MSEQTWHIYIRELTPEQVEFLRRCDENPTHPDGADAHRRGMITLARMYAAQGPGSLN